MAYNVEQRLQEYLRHNYTPDVFKVGRMHELTEAMLVQVARDWDTSNKQSHPASWYRTVASQAIDTYLENWSDKMQGTDDRGHRFGKSSTFT